MKRTIRKLLQINLKDVNMDFNDMWEDYSDLQDDVAQIFKDRLVETGHCTPDFPLLQKKEAHYFFVYDAMSKGGKFHHYMHDQEFITLGWTTVPFDFYSVSNTKMKANKNFVAVPKRMNGDNSKSAVIAGEIYLVTPKFLQEMDYLLDNGTEHFRIMNSITLPENKDGTKLRQEICHMYILNQKYLHNRKDYKSEHHTPITSNSGMKYHRYFNYLG